MSDWNLDRLRKIAGLNESAKSESKVLNESWDEDDDYDDQDVKIAMSDKRQKQFEKKNKKELDDNAEMMRKRTEEQRKAAEEKKAAKKSEEKKEEKPAPKAEEKKPEPKKAEAKPEEKKEEKPAPKAEEKPAEKKEEAPKAEEKAAEEKKRRGKAPNPGSKAQRALAKLKTMTRGEFIKWAAEELEMGKNYASAYYARHNPKSSREQKVTEAPVLWGLAHPFLKGFVLAENREMNQLQWIDADSKLEPMLFVSEAEAQKIAKHMAEWKSQTAVVESYDFKKLDEEDAE